LARRSELAAALTVIGPTPRRRDGRFSSTSCIFRNIRSA
jgi:hypothetical protein